MNFNLKLKKIRTFRKMTQKELSEKIGLTDQHRMTSKLVTEVYRCNYKGLNRLYYFGKYYKWNQLSQVENGLISLSKDKLNRKIQIINTVYKSQDVKWDRHMMKYENWIAFQDWKEKN